MTMLEIVAAIATALVPLLAAWITKHAVPWIKARTTAEQRKVLADLIRELVYAAEQLYKIGAVEDRKAYVEQRLSAQGVELEAKERETMIEAAVMEMRIQREWGTGEGVARQDGSGMGDPPEGKRAEPQADLS
jgi:hypothetical protein